MDVCSWAVSEDHGMHKGVHDLWIYWIHSGSWTCQSLYSKVIWLCNFTPLSSHTSLATVQTSDHVSSVLRMLQVIPKPVGRHFISPMLLELNQHSYMELGGVAIRVIDNVPWSPMCNGKYSCLYLFYSWRANWLVFHDTMGELSFFRTSSVVDYYGAGNELECVLRLKAYKACWVWHKHMMGMLTCNVASKRKYSGI